MHIKYISATSMALSLQSACQHLLLKFNMASSKQKELVILNLSKEISSSIIYLDNRHVGTAQDLHIQAR